jgi:hypothetical protein
MRLLDLEANSLQKPINNGPKRQVEVRGWKGLTTKT